MAKQFQKRVEDFTCAKCGALVQGSGYTNHCPVCLWSKHVDINPGDRGESCGGMMEPISAYQEGGKYILLHECTKCRVRRPNRTASEDDFDVVIEIFSKSNGSR